MPGKSRAEVIDPSAVGTYHAMARCVRRGFLLGEDALTNKDHSHRRCWVRHRIRYLARYFGIELLFFGFLSNHYHLVLRNRPDLVEGWDDEEVMRRACRIFPWKFERLGVPPNSRVTQATLEKLVADRELVREMRIRLADPSWFMRQLNQYIAKRANSEDGVSGHFFEQRFKAERIPDLLALIICGLYVDLNAIVAGLADSPSDSRDTSLYARVRAKSLRSQDKLIAIRLDGFLTPVFGREEPDRYRLQGKRGAYRASSDGLLDLDLDQYAELAQVLIEYHHQTKRDDRRKPALPRRAIQDYLTHRNLLAHITADVAV